MDVQMGYDQLRLTPGAWLDLLGGDARWNCNPVAAMGLPRPKLARDPASGRTSSKYRASVRVNLVEEGTAPLPVGSFVREASPG